MKVCRKHWACLC